MGLITCKSSGPVMPKWKFSIPNLTACIACDWKPKKWRQSCKVLIGLWIWWGDPTNTQLGRRPFYFSSFEKEKIPFGFSFLFFGNYFNFTITFVSLHYCPNTLIRKKKKMFFRELVIERNVIFLKANGSSDDQIESAKNQLHKY